jgi:hypothetical protein
MTWILTTVKTSNLIFSQVCEKHNVCKRIGNFILFCFCIGLVTTDNSMQNVKMSDF